MSSNHTQPRCDRRHRWLLVTVAFAILSCDGQISTHIGNPPEGSLNQRQLSLQLQTDEQNGKALLRDSTQLAVTLSVAMAAIEAVLLPLPAGSSCDDFTLTDTSTRCDSSTVTGVAGDAIVVAGPFVADLINGVVTPQTTALLPADLVFERGFLVFADRGDEFGLDPDDPLLEDSLYLLGTMSYMGQEILVEMFVEAESSSLEVDTVAETSTDGQVVRLVLTIDATEWLANLDLADCFDRGAFVVEDGRLEAEDHDQGCASPEDVIKHNIFDNSENDDASD